MIQTIGKDIVAIDFHRGWCIEFASTTTVVIATLLEVPVSTTHCQIGAVTAVGIVAFGRNSVHWNLIGKIVASWVLTLPLSGLLAVAALAIIRAGIKR